MNLRLEKQGIDNLDPEGKTKYVLKEVRLINNTVLTPKKGQLQNG